MPRVLESAQGARVRIDGREVVSFSSNDYLGLAAHEGIARAAEDAVARWGVGAGSSRLIVGNSAVHAELEEEAARWLGTEASRLFNSGSAANTGVLPVLAGPGDQIFSDELNHASIIDGCRLSRARVQVFRHRNLNDLDEMLGRAGRGRRLVVTESLFSMDGDRSDLAGLREVADQHGAMLLVDEAHGCGVFGAGGAGLLAESQVRAEAVMATLGKALGVYGAVVAGGRALCDVLWNRARSLVFTTGLPPMIAVAGIAAIGVVRGPEGDARRSTLRSRIGQLAAGLREIGIDVDAGSPIVPLVVGGDRAVMEWTSRLLERGCYVQGVRPPTVPEGTARLRVALSAAHSEDDVARLLGALAAGLEAGGRFVPRGTEAS